MQTANTFYKSSRWRKKREKILRRDGYQCVEAKRYGQYEEATTVHHIYPREDYPELEYADWNLISVSGKRHDTFHDRTTGAVTDKGKYWQNKRKREFEEWKGRQPPGMGNAKLTGGNRARELFPIARDSENKFSGRIGGENRWQDTYHKGRRLLTGQSCT